MEKPTVTILIPNHNGRKILANNLPGIKKVDSVKDIIVVDDYSNDGSVDFVRNNFPDVKVIEKKNRNQGFSSTVNFGLQEVKTDLVALINSDVVPEPDCIEKSLRYFADPKLFAVGFLDRSHEKDGVVLRGRGTASWKKGFYVHARGEVDKTDTAWVSGGSGIFRVSIFKKLGGFDELFDPFYWEDIDLSYRARKQGYSILFAPECRVNHYHEQGAIKSAYTPNQIKAIAFRNELIFHWKNLTDSKILIAHLFTLNKYLVRSLIKADLTVITGFESALVKCLQIVSVRKKQRLSSVFTDKGLNVL